MTFFWEKKILAPQVDIQGRFPFPATQAALWLRCKSWSLQVMASHLPVHPALCCSSAWRTPVTLFTHRTAHPLRFCSRVTSGVFTSHSQPNKCSFLCEDFFPMFTCLLDWGLWCMRDPVSCSAISLPPGLAQLSWCAKVVVIKDNLIAWRIFFSL